MSQQYNLYWEYFLLKHKSWHENVNNYWGGTSPYPGEDKDGLYFEDDNNSLVKCRYVDQFRGFQQTIDIMALEIVYGDVDRLGRIFIECGSTYNKG